VGWKHIDTNVPVVELFKLSENHSGMETEYKSATCIDILLVEREP